MHLQQRRYTMLSLILCSAVVLILAGSPAGAQVAAPFGSASADNHHSVSTSNADAQAAFDEGMLYRYAFNSWGAIEAFRRAATLDPQLAMAHWGIALALGPDINTTPTPARDAEAAREISLAQGLQAYASSAERAYIGALALRYSGPKSSGARNYSSAMERLTRALPDDPDASALYAESLMVLQPDGIFFAHGQARGSNPGKVIRWLAGVLKRFPHHLGANHLLIHAVSQSDTPEHGLPSAEFLASQSYPPGASHLVHMAVHIFYRVGRYRDAIMASTVALGLDDLCSAQEHPPVEYSSLWYHLHNAEYLLAASMMAADFSAAKAAVAKLDDGIDQLHLLIRFAEWEEILGLTPPASSPSQPALEREFYFARVLAAAALGRAADVRSSASLFAKAKAKVAERDSSSHQIAEIQSEIVLSASARSQNRAARELSGLRSAVSLQDALVEEDLPLFFMPVREMLGDALLRKGDKTEARAVFLADLKRNPQNPRSLAGLGKARQ